MSVTHGMDTAAGLAASSELERGSQEVVGLATRLDGVLHSFDWSGTDATRVRESWSTTHRPQLDQVTQQLGLMAAALRREAEAQDSASEPAGAGAGSGAGGTTQTGPPSAQQLVTEARAAGLSGDALDRYAAQVRAMTPAQRAALDPATFRGSDASQPDGTTCGSSTLVMSRMENNPAYAMYVLTGYDPVTGSTDPGTRGERFAAESLKMHEQTNGWFDRGGGLQSAWPQALGTAPGPLAQEMSAPGGSGVPGTDYRVDYVRFQDRASSFDDMVAASRGGHTVPVYVGNDTAPRHVVLVTGASADGGSLTFYEPSAGATVTVTREQWLADRSGLGGWNKPWLIVTPRK